MARCRILAGMFALACLGSLAAMPSAPPSSPPSADSAQQDDEDLHAAVIILEIFEGQGRPRPRIGFIAEPGVIITNRHCIEGASRARIRLSDERTISIRGIIAESENDDLAVLALDATPEALAALPRLRLCEHHATVGEPVRILHRDVHVGEPLEQAGRILQIEQSIWHGPDITTSALGSFGTSGSPLVNEQGDVVGIVRAGHERDEGEASSAAPAWVALGLPRTDPVPLEQWWEKHDRPGWRQGRDELQWAYWHKRSGEPGKAARFARQALAHDPKQARAWLVISRIHFDAGEFEDAAKAVEQWLELEPEHAAVWALYGWTLHHNNRLDEALEAYRKSMSLSPNFYAGYSMAIILARLGREPEVLDVLRRTIEFAPERSELWMFLATVHHRAERFEEALVAYAEAARRKPADPRPLYWTAQIHRQLDDPVQAEHWFRKAIAASPEAHESYCSLAQFLIEQGRLEDAAPLYEEAILRKSNCIESIRGLIRCARARKDLSTAREWTDRLNALKDDSHAGHGCRPDHNY